MPNENSRNLYSNQPIWRNIETEPDSADEEVLYNLADTFMKQTNLS